MPSTQDETIQTSLFSKDPAAQSLKLAQESLLHLVAFLGGFGVLLILLQFALFRQSPSQVKADLTHPASPIIVPQKPPLPNPEAVPTLSSQLELDDPRGFDPKLAGVTPLPVPLSPTPAPRLNPTPALPQPPLPQPRITVPAKLSVVTPVAVAPAKTAPVGNPHATIRCFNKAGELYYEGPAWGVSQIERSKACR